MEKVRPWCGQPSDRGRLKNRNRTAYRIGSVTAQVDSVVLLNNNYRITIRDIITFVRSSGLFRKATGEAT